MATTMPDSPRQGPRVRASARGGETGRDAQYDLLTAALIGAAIGATATLLLRRGPSGQRPVTPVMRGAKWAGRGAAAAGLAGGEGGRGHRGGGLPPLPPGCTADEVPPAGGGARPRDGGVV